MSTGGIDIEPGTDGIAPAQPKAVRRMRLALLLGVTLIVAGAVYLAVTRADALLLDLAALAQCF